MLERFKISNETIVGAFVFTALAVLFLGFNYLKGNNLFESSDLYHIRYDQTQGVSKSSPVIYNGLKVGSIKDLKLDESGSGKIIVSFNILNKMKLPKGTVAEIVSTSLLDSKAIKLELGSSPEMYSKGAFLEGKVQKTLMTELGDRVPEMEKKLNNVLSSMDTLVIQINKVARNPALTNSINTADRTMKNLEATSKTINALSMAETDEIKRIIQNVEAVTIALNQSKTGINSMVNNLDKVSASLAKADFTQTVNNLSETLKQVQHVTEQINQGEGTVGQLVKDKKLYDNLAATTKSLDELLKDMKSNPKRYVQFSLIQRRDKTQSKVDSSK